MSENRNRLPEISGSESTIESALANRVHHVVEHSRSIKSAAAVALHMHQPLIPAGGEQISTSAIISNLDYMMRHQGSGDNHNAPQFLHCYKRMGEIIPELVSQGKSPRIMLEYSGCLLYGLQLMGAQDVIDALHNITTNPDYSPCVEWLGAPWGHAVAPSTPMQDFRLHVKAWQNHFVSLFGIEALKEVKGFSPSEMALPNHPDLAYEYISILKECGYSWLLVQEHTVEDSSSGETPRESHIPHRLVCTNSAGESVSIIAVIKTQGSDTKLVGQMQPYYEAKGCGPVNINGREVPQLVVQIADGENGGVMMNEFPGKYREVVNESRYSETPLMNVSEYLDLLFSMGVSEEQLPQIQPLFQKRIFDLFTPGEGAEALERVIAELKAEDNSFHMEGGSWTNNLSWVRGYEDVLAPMDEASVLFYEKVLRPGADSSSYDYRNALYHLLCSQTSCYRYWGQGVWTEYGKELCRRTMDICRYDFQ